MTLKVISGALLAVVGTAGTLLGLLFLIASHGDGIRLLAGGILGAAGTILLIFGVKIFRKGIRFSPESIRNTLLKLARMNNGEVTSEEIIGELGSSGDIDFQVNNLVKWGIAAETNRDNRKLYVFSDFQTKIIVKQCPYCGNDYPVRDDIEQCPSCGGDLQVQKTVLAENGKRFSMDEGDDSSLS